MGISLVPDSISKLDIRKDLYLINNSLDILPKNFNTIFCALTVVSSAFMSVSVLASMSV